jgi:hypothetical protein
MRRLSIIISLLFLVLLSSFGQESDLIIKRGGEKVFCKIYDIDSIFIKYETPMVINGNPVGQKFRLRLDQVAEYIYDYKNNPDYAQLEKKEDLLDLPQNYKAKEQTRGRHSLTDDQLRYAIKNCKSSGGVGLLFTLGGGATFIVGMVKRSDYVSERKSCLSDLDFDGYNEAQDNAKKMAIVAVIGAGITAIGLPVWLVNSSKANSYKNMLLSRGLEANITPFTDYNSQLKTPYSGLTLTIKF